MRYIVFNTIFFLILILFLLDTHFAHYKPFDIQSNISSALVKTHHRNKNIFHYCLHDNPRHDVLLWFLYCG